MGDGSVPAIAQGLQLRATRMLQEVGPTKAVQKAFNQRGQDNARHDSGKSRVEPCVNAVLSLLQSSFRC